MIAAWGYNQAIIGPAVDKIIQKIYSIISGTQNPFKERQYLYDHYQTLQFPFERINTSNFEMKMNWNLMQWLGYMHTWPSALEYEKKYGVNLVSEAESELVKAWVDPRREKPIIWSIHLLSVDKI